MISRGAQRSVQMILRASGGAVAVAAVFLASGASDVIDQIDVWKAVGELGIAIVFAVLGFLGMVWWIRKRGAEQREDSLRMASRIDALETFQQTKLLDLTRESTAATTAAVEATRENTAQLIRVTDALSTMCSRVNARPCAAIESLPDIERARVMAILRGRYASVAD